MMPKHDVCPFGYHLAAIHYQLNDLIKMCFACGNVSRVNVIRLESGEVQLTGSNIVAMNERKYR